MEYDKHHAPSNATSFFTQNEFQNNAVVVIASKVLSLQKKDDELLSLMDKDKENWQLHILQAMHSV